MQSNESQKDEQKTKMLARLMILSGFLILSLFVFNGNIFNTKKTDVIATPAQAITKSINPFKYVSVEAKSAYVYDLAEKRILFSKNEQSQLPLASLTKLMTALVASKLVSNETIITIGKKSIAVDGDNGFHINERWKFKDLLDYTLIVSSNDGANAIATFAGSFVGDSKQKDTRRRFIGQMNKTAKYIGLTQSYFLNESGLDTSTQISGGYGSARDVSSLLSYIISNKPQILEATTYNTINFISEDQFVYNATNTNPIVGNIPGLIASKTGFTDLAGGNLAIAFDAGINHPIVIVVLGSSFEGRFKDIKILVKASLKEIAL